MGDREERNAVKRDALDAGIGVEDPVEEQMAAFVGRQPDRGAAQETTRPQQSDAHSCSELRPAEPAAGAELPASAQPHQNTTVTRIAPILQTA